MAHALGSLRAPGFQGEWGGSCVQSPLPGLPTPAPGVALLWDEDRPGTSPVQPVPSPCSVSSWQG